MDKAIDKVSLDCPYCQFHFCKLAVNDKDLPELAPVLCSNCLIISLFELGKGIRKLTEPEMEAVKQSEVWGFLEKAREVLVKIPVELRTQ